MDQSIWLGKRFTFEEHSIAMPIGLVAELGAAREHPDTTWDSHLFDAVIGVPWDPWAKNRGEDVAEPHERVAGLPRVVGPRSWEDDIPKARNVMLGRQYFENLVLPMVAGNVCHFRPMIFRILHWPIAMHVDFEWSIR